MSESPASATTTRQPWDFLPQGVRNEITRRSLWGHLPRRVQAAPEGPPQLALSFDLDYQADTDALPGLVELVAQLDICMTLFCIGKLVQSDPNPYRQAADAGHEIANHTWSHPDNPILNPDNEFWHLSVDEMHREISLAQDILQQLTGQRATTFRTPHFKDAPRMLEALSQLPEITCISTTLASKCPVPTPYFPDQSQPDNALSLHFASTAGVDAAHSPLMIPLTPCPGMRWSPFCSYSAIRVPRDAARGAGLLDTAQWEQRWFKMLEGAKRRRFASVYFDPLDVMRDDDTCAAFRRMLSGAKQQGWQVTTLAALESSWRTTRIPGAG